MIRDQFPYKHSLKGRFEYNSIYKIGCKKAANGMQIGSKITEKFHHKKSASD